MAENEGPIA